MTFKGTDVRGAKSPLDITVWKVQRKTGMRHKLKTLHRSALPPWLAVSLDSPLISSHHFSVLSSLQDKTEVLKTIRSGFYRAREGTSSTFPLPENPVCRLSQTPTKRHMDAEQTGSKTRRQPERGVLLVGRGRDGECFPSTSVGCYGNTAQPCTRTLSFGADSQEIPSEGFESAETRGGLGFSWPSQGSSSFSFPSESWVQVCKVS